MRTISLALSVALLATSVLGQGPKPVKDKPLDTTYLRQHAQTRGFMLGRPVRPKITPDGKAVLFLRAQARPENAPL
jgi:dipeptidyl-peptidase-4